LSDRKSSDIVFITNLNAQLTALMLNLRGLPEPPTPEAEPTSQLLEISLAVACAVLGTLLIASVVFYIVKTRRYDRELKALSENNFGDVDSDLKPNPKPLPNTNIFAQERHNPAMTNIAKLSRPEIDTESILSSDSDDFAGLPDSKIFDISQAADKASGTTDINNSSYI
jgi:hypothetical protein